MKKIILAAMALAGLLTTAGCATPPAPSPEDLAKRAAIQAEAFRTIPICVDEKDCNDKWEAAQLWVVNHAGYKIQTATNVLIETYSAVGDYEFSSLFSARVTKEPIGGGRYRLLVTIWCGVCKTNPWDTPTDPWAAALDFNRTVGAATNRVRP